MSDEQATIALEPNPWHVPAVPAITPEQVAEFHRRQRVQEEQEMQAFIAELQMLAEKRGYVIVAIPQLDLDGRIVATWGVRRK